MSGRSLATAGSYLLDELTCRQISYDEFATQCGMLEATILDMILYQSEWTPEKCALVGNTLGTSTVLWLNLSGLKETL